jgi:hypothetical protein
MKNAQQYRQKYQHSRHYQRGLSLLWVALFMGSLAAMAMAGLYWMRYDRNPLAEGWASLMRNSDAAETLKKSQRAVAQARDAINGSAGATAVNADPGALRKCIVEGRVTYSNVECSPHNATSRLVQVHDTQGFEAPKKPPQPKDEMASATVQQKAMDQAIEKATH